ncbi:MAG: transposase zinc-binding domain-containing protein [Deltaproteobacteria bacterium]|nr:transposase zinc-binding domain-containing protein [Deltaproteobacteria bacterium]
MFALHLRALADTRLSPFIPQGVAFSCKGRGLCPSCQGRRMAETAARLTDALLPSARYRQVVFTFPFAVRLRMPAIPRRSRRCCAAANARSLRS